MPRRLVLVLALAACRDPAVPRSPAAPAAPVAPKPAVTPAPEALRVGDAAPLTGRIDFRPERDTLLPSATPVLDDLAAFLIAHPELVLVEVQGHLAVDRDREAYGRKLSQARADAVRAYLVHQGVAPDRLTTEGYEDSRPLVPYDAPDAALANERIELRILALR